MRNPFVMEVLRIIKLAKPREYGEEAVILVSRRFYNEAQEEVSRRNELLGSDVLALTGYLYIRGVLSLAVPWLSDYEFNIRPNQNDPRWH